MDSDPVPVVDAFQLHEGVVAVLPSGNKTVKQLQKENDALKAERDLLAGKVNSEGSVRESLGTLLSPVMMKKSAQDALRAIQEQFTWFKE